MDHDTTSEGKRPPASGRFLVRIDPGLHAALRARAASRGISLNRHCAGKLGSPDSELPAPGVGTVRRALEDVGESLLGVVAFGSWARGHPSWESDLDVLLVVGEEVAVSRALYRRWDERPALEWDGHRVEPHFVHLPGEGETPSGLWAEVAVDGLVLFERRLLVSRALAAVRRLIVADRISQRISHGNPYWVREG